jgi:hypothetical protein
MSPFSSSSFNSGTGSFTKLVGVIGGKEVGNINNTANAIAWAAWAKSVSIRINKSSVGHQSTDLNDSNKIVPTVYSQELDLSSQNILLLYISMQQELANNEASFMQDHINGGDLHTSLSAQTPKQLLDP